MLLPKDVRSRITKEFRYAAEQMQKAADPARKLYFFSALYGETGRMLNQTWDRDLVLVHVTLLNAHTQMTGRLQTPPAGTFRFPEGFFDVVGQAVADLVEYMEEGKEGRESLLDILGRFAELSHIMTGNGSYLFEKGMVKF